MNSGYTRVFQNYERRSSSTWTTQSSDSNMNNGYTSVSQNSEKNRRRVKYACLATLLLVILPLVIALINLWPRTEESVKLTLITSLHSAHNILEKMDPSKNPCDDFWLYSCGQYIKTQAPLQSLAYNLEMNVKAEMQRSADEELTGLLEEPNKESTIEPVKMVKKLYSSCTKKDITARNIKKDLLNLSQKLGGVPMVSGQSFSGDHTSILRNYFNVTGLLPLFSYYILEKNQKSSKVISFHSSFRCYSKSIGNIAAAMKVFFSEFINFENIFHFYHKLAELTQKRYFTNEDDFPSGIRYTSNELNQTLSGLDLVGIFDEILKDTNETAKDVKFITQTPEALRNITKLILETHTTDFMNILFLETLHEFYGLIPEVGIDFLETLYSDVKTNTFPSNQFASPPRKKSCLDIAHLAEDILGWMYSEKYFDEQIQNKVSEMVDYLLRATEGVLLETDWLEEPSKHLALEKLKDLKKRIYIGRHSSENIKEDLIKSYADVSLTDKFLSNIITMRKVDSRIKRTLKKNRNIINQNTVNAVYDVFSNSIILPVALMKPPLFSKDAPMSINFGGLGTLIGHEILHAFHDDYVNFHVNSKLLNDESHENLKELKRMVIETYSHYEIKSLNAYVNGARTVKENIADLGGLNIAYKAYLLWKSDHPNVKFYLPGVNMSDSKVFFTAFSQASCSSELRQTAIYSLLTDTHAPSEARVQVPLQNYDAFSESFSCAKGRKMNPEYKIKIW